MPRRSPPVPMELQPLMGHSMREFEAGLRRRLGMDDPNLLGMGTGMTLGSAYRAIPSPPVSPAAHLASAAALRAQADGVDRISRLPDQILRHIVSHLPAKDAARTGALASRWRGIWRSAPLVFIDAQILPDSVQDERAAPGGDGTLSKAVVAAVSRALDAHPGPIRCFHLTRGHMASHEAEAERWLKLLAARGVQELVFFNHPWPLDFPLPAALFSCASLTHLYLGIWRLPDTAKLPRRTRFPNLKELLLGFILMRDGDLAFFVEKSPVLENLTIIGSQIPVSLRLVSRSLRCVQLGMSGITNVSVVDVPRLERLFMWVSMPHMGSRIKIGHAPNLRMLGYWQPGDHELEVGSTVIKTSSKVSPSTVVPTVKIMALEVEFDVCNDVKMVPCFLKCFPNVETLHVYSQKEADEPSTGKLDFNFWQEAGPIECVQSHVKKFVFQQFRGNRSELMFLKFIAERAQVLKKMVIMVAVGCFSSEDDMRAKLKLLTLVKWASQDCKVILVMNPDTEQGSPAWSFRKASDSSFRDPFDLLAADSRIL